MLKRLLYLTILFYSIIAVSQEPVSVNLSEKDGLPDREFYDIIEDSKGFMWLCSSKGLFRYDGKDFKNYTNKDKRGLSVFGVKEDAQGRIWCNNITGQFFYVENGNLKSFIDLKEELKGELVNFLVRNNHLLVFTGENIYKIDLESKKINLVLGTPHIYGSPYVFDHDIYIGNGISLLKMETDSLVEIVPFKIPARTATNRAIVSGKSQMVKIDSLFLLRQLRGLKNALFLINSSQKSFKQSKNFKEIEEEKIQYLFVNDKEVWFCSTSGIWIYEVHQGEFQFKKRILVSKNISKVVKDKDDNYWITTLNSGVYVVPNIHIQQHVISENNKNLSSLDKIDQETLLFGATSGNVGLYNIKTTTEKIIDIPVTSRVSSLKYNSNKQISYIALDENGFVLNHKTLKINKVQNFLSTKSFSILNDNEFLSSSYNSVIIRKQADPEKRVYISKNRRPYMSYFDKKKQTTFIAYVDDLVCYDSIWQPQTIRYENNPIYGLTISQTSNTIVWVGSFKNGIYGIKNNKVIAHLNTKNGLVSNRIEKIKANGNNLWIATDSGIQKYNTDSKTFKTLTKRDGILSYDISGIEVVENKVVFASNEGLFSIDKEKAFKTQKPRELYFNTLEINDENTALKSNYTFDYTQNTIKIGFNVNGFQFNQKGTYTYRLLGLNPKWVVLEKGVNYVKYNSLPAGNYTFEVAPILNTNSTNNVIKSLKFTIQNPYWKRWWFFVLLISILFFTMFYYFKKRISRKEKEQQVQVKQLQLNNQITSLKLENLRSQMNPHFIFNALNSIQEYIILNKKEEASDYLGKFSDLIRGYLNGSINEKILIEEEIEALKTYLELEKMRFEDTFTYRIHFDVNTRNESFYIPTMLLQPYIENAIKHGLLHKKGAKILSVKGKMTTNETNEKVLYCEIADNGIGRKKSKEIRYKRNKLHTSFATKASENRLDLLSKQQDIEVGVVIEDLYDENSDVRGTRVVLKIPVSHKA